MATADNVATFDSLAAQTEVFRDLVKTANVNAPIFTNYMKAVDKTGSKIEWFDQKLKVTKVALDANHTDGGNSFTLVTSGLLNQYAVIPGVTQIMFLDGSARFNVTAWNSGTRVATVTLDQGTDKPLSSGGYIKLIRNTPIGENFGTQSDVSYATSDYNFFSNFSYTIKIANPNVKGQFTRYIDEIDFENQVANNVPEAIDILEFRALKDFRVEGTGAPERNNAEVQGGDGSSAGGVLTLGNARSMYTVSSGNANYTEDTLETDIIELRDRGAFQTNYSNKTRDTELKYCKIYVSAQGLGQLNKNVRLVRDAEAYFGSSDKIGGIAGTFTTKFLVDNVVLEAHVTSAFEVNEILYVPREDLISIEVLRMLEQQPEDHGGDNTTRMYNVTFSVCVKSPWLLGYRSNLQAFS